MPENDEGDTKTIVFNSFGCSPHRGGRRHHGVEFLVEVSGRVEGLAGHEMKLVGLNDFATVGSVVRVAGGGAHTEAEITHFSGSYAHANPLDSLHDMPASANARIVLPPRGRTLSVSDAWKGRVVDAIGHPIDGKGQLLAWACSLLDPPTCFEIPMAVGTAGRSRGRGD